MLPHPGPVYPALRICSAVCRACRQFSCVGRPLPWSASNPRTDCVLPASRHLSVFCAGVMRPQDSRDLAVGLLYRSDRQIRRLALASRKVCRRSLGCRFLSMHKRNSHATPTPGVHQQPARAGCRQGVAAAEPHPGCQWPVHQRSGY
ncbi:hypothetical protein D3C85_1284370 [compost metagenome]